MCVSLICTKLKLPALASAAVAGDSSRAHRPHHAGAGPRHALEESASIETVHGSS
jgi:hypothetical protein